MRLRVFAVCIAAFVASGCARQSTPIPAVTRPLSHAAIESQETILHSFGGPDGAAPSFGIIADAAGNFYGTTIFGGSLGGGAFFKLARRGNAYDESVLYSFTGSSGQAPFGTVAMDARGALYSGTLTGGIQSCGCGTVVKLTPSKNGYTPSVLYKFHPAPDANQVVGTLVINRGGDVFGATQIGGDSNNGAVFELTPGKSGYTEKVIYSLPGGTGGYLPQAGLAIDRRGDIFGTTYYGGNMSSCGGGCGVVFELVTPSYAPKTLYAFNGKPDGAQPFAAPSLDDRTGAIFGSTQYGGPGGLGSVFKLVPSGGSYRESVLHGFSAKNHEGILAQSPILIGPDGSLYGTTALGGESCRGVGCGTVFKLTRSRSSYAFTELYKFEDPVDGAEPDGTALVLGSDGSLYGGTRSGGTKTNCGDGGPGGVSGCGVIFRLRPAPVY